MTRPHNNPSGTLRTPETSYAYAMGAIDRVSAAVCGGLAEARDAIVRLDTERRQALRELAEARAELERVAAERDAAREALAAHRCHPEQAWQQAIQEGEELAKTLREQMAPMFRGPWEKP